MFSADFTSGSRDFTQPKRPGTDFRWFWPRDTKICMRTHLARVGVTRARHSHRKLKLMFSPFGRSVPSLKINLISCCLRLMLLPAHCFKPQTMMSSSEREAESKCLATGNPRDRFQIVRSCSLKRSRSRLLVSPMYRQLQRRQEMQYTTFSD